MWESLEIPYVVDRRLRVAYFRSPALSNRKYEGLAWTKCFMVSVLGP